MSKDIPSTIQLKENTYSKLLEEISAAYEKTRLSMVRMYWNIGKYIDGVEKNHDSRNIILIDLIRRLSADLMEKYGKGFSVTNLNNMRNFHNMYSFDQISDKLEWSNYVTLLSVKNEDDRKLLEARAVNEGLKYKELRKIVSRDFLNSRRSKEEKVLKFSRGLLHTYSLMGHSRLPGSEGCVVVDCGFNIWKRIPVSDEEKFRTVNFVTPFKKNNTYGIKSAGEIDPKLIYTYKAYIEKIIDGDTLWAVIDCGFETFVRQKLRLRGIDTPEMDTREGKKAKDFVSGVLKDCPFAVIRTHKSDKYDRYLSDIFYLPDTEDAEKVAAEGRFLNGELVDQGIAVIV